MKLKKRDLLRLNNAIAAIEGRSYSRKFGYFIAKTKLEIKDEVLIMQEFKAPSESFKAYDTKRSELARDHADRNSDGSPKIQNQEFLITVKMDQFQEALANLKEEYKEVIEEREQQIKEFEEILDEETKFDGTKIDLKDIPDDIEPVVIEVLLSAGLISED